MKTEENDLKNLVKNALQNEDLQKGLKKAIKNFKEHRKEALSGIDFFYVQQEIKAIKEKSIEKLSENIDLFKKNCIKNRIIVLETDTADETRRKVLEIIQKHNGKKVVKSKSMVCDEIDLNEYLEEHKVEAIETDLGEWLIQLAGERPSHITAPAIHMTKERVAKLLNDKFNVDLPADPQVITKFARDKLRKEFIEADIGISGANLLVAETGSVIIISNEGNARLVTTLPHVHIVVTTPEKLVSTMSDAERILSILPKSATGQNITSYVSIISGPSKTADIEKELVYGVHGPEFVYLIIMDNGRKAMLNDPDFKEVLNCIKCGACLGMCPVYQAVGGHVFGRKYIGGVGAILTAFLENIDKSMDLTRLCSGCSICKTICPVQVDIPRMTLKLKEELFSNKKLSLSKEMIIKGLFSHKGIFETALTGASLFQNVIWSNQNEIIDLPGPLSGLTKFRALPKLPKKTFNQRVKDEKILLPYDPAKKSYVFFSGCLAEKVYPDAAIKAVKLLQKVGVNVIYPEGMTCCGVPALYSGDTKDYKKFIAENKKAFSSYQDKQIEAIFTICPSCTKAITGKGFLNNTTILDFSQLLLNLHQQEPLSINNIANVTYHPSCHHSQDKDYLTYTHKLLLELFADKFISYEDMYNCCGAAGSYALEFPEISENILNRKLENIIKADVKTIITDCPACLMQIKGAVTKKKIDLNVVFITDIFNI